MNYPHRPAGLGVSTQLPWIDFETYSEAGYEWDEARQKWGSPDGASGTARGLPIVGAAAYAEHATAECLMMAYDLQDGRGPRQWFPGLPAPLDLWSHVSGGGLLEAWNVGFERWIWSRVLVPRFGFPAWPIAQQRCAMAKSRAFSLPGKLEAAAQVLGTAPKDPEGVRLMKIFSMPRNPTKGDPRRRITLAELPDEANKYCAYNVQDGIAEDEISRLCPDLEGEELQFWLADQAINFRGVHIDRAGVDDCIAIIDAAHTQLNAELFALTGATVERASELQKLKGWLGASGAVMGSMDEDGITAALQRTDLVPAARRALEIRQAVGSASVKKVYAMALQATRADRLHDLFSYHAARTGRATGNGPQPTNLPREGPPVYICPSCKLYHGTHRHVCPWCCLPGPPVRTAADWSGEAAEQALSIIAGRSWELVADVYGDAMAAVSGSLRALFDAAPGHDLISSDYSAIEAVVLAALAGESWRLEVFRAKRDIYVESISRITGTPPEVYAKYKADTGKNHPDRQRGKIAELASGYQGWIGAWLAFGADKSMTEDEIKAAILAWREASPSIPYFWGGQPGWRNHSYFGVEGAAVSALMAPGVPHVVTRADGSSTGVTFTLQGAVLFCTLPSGRHMAYHRPQLEQNVERGGYSLSYEGWNSNPKNGPPGWIRIRTWGGRLVENIVQAVARDILRHAIVNLEREGYPVVLHVYDEIVSEVPHAHGSVEEFERIMATLPAWCAGWPIRADGGWRGRRYRKG